MENAALMDLVFEEIGHQVPRRLPFLLKRFEGEGMILSYPDQGYYARHHNLNQISRDIYELCDGVRTCDQIRTLMMEKYPQLPPQVVSQHVIQGIRMMQRKEILASP